MARILIYFLVSLPFFQSKETKYMIVAGDITCKSCVIELHAYLNKKTKKENLSIALRDKGYLILNESSLNYYQREIPRAQFQFLTSERFFKGKEKYPYLFIITGKDSLKLPYDSLYAGDQLRIKHLK